MQIAKGYGKLKQAFRFKHFLNEESKINLIETYILSPLNYGDVILQNLTEQLQYKLQKLQNSCVRFAYGLRKYDHISGVIKNKCILNLKSRRLLHSLTLMYKIKIGKAPSYLCNRIRTHIEIHHHFTRNRNDIHTPFARTKARNMSYFVHISKKFNELNRNINIANVSVNTFKLRCKRLLLLNQ